MMFLKDNQYWNQAGDLQAKLFHYLDRGNVYAVFLYRFTASAVNAIAIRIRAKISRLMS
jgi:hypothetical protein